MGVFSFSLYRMTRLKRKRNSTWCLLLRSRTSHCSALMLRNCVRILTLTGWLQPALIPMNVSLPNVCVCTISY